MNKIETFLNRPKPDKKSTRWTHGCSKKNETSEYRSWRGMHQRCSSPNHKLAHRYSNRGIKVCNRWKSFQNFLLDMGFKPTNKHTIERINSDKDYEPENCKWATKLEQGRNTSRTVFITYNGKTLPASKWTELLGMKRRTLLARIRLGWSIEDAITRPVQ